LVWVLTGRRRARVYDAGSFKHDEPAVPDESASTGHAVCWVLGETLEAARLGAAAVVLDSSRLPALVNVKDAIAGARAFQGASRP
jgi:xanthine dehydrogenase large subunit